MPETDKRHNLDNDIFTYHVNKDGKVLIYWYGKRVMILKGVEAQKFSARVKNLSNHEVQLTMARAIGNFKRGNKR
jgi:hypothetical protein